MTDKNIEVNYISPLPSIVNGNETMVPGATLRKIFADQSNKVNLSTKVFDFFKSIYTGEHKNEKLLRILETITRKNEIKIIT